MSSTIGFTSLGNSAAIALRTFSSCDDTPATETNFWNTSLASFSRDTWGAWEKAQTVITTESNSAVGTDRMQGILRMCDSSNTAPGIVERPSAMQRGDSLLRNGV